MDEPDMVNAEKVLRGMLQDRTNSNCTLYLIWHYVKQGELEYAQSEFVRDSDKLGGGEARATVQKLLGL